VRPSGAGQGRASGAGEAGLALPRDVQRWPPEAREELEERIAVMVYDAKMSEERAEKAAVQIVRERHGHA
jgi:hypothetical protein